ncbi:stalk domain-containing protein [Cytobacillus massiliigabonensis]|uniref:stalk domain-containing protein n=1 Tax=Cytobacillus massiliigabonensis TaxID=1871011 RepID=UPI000C83DFAC|nr:stalk domain-containing protein [Cytobacillus massiliigabonensis]
MWRTASLLFVALITAIGAMLSMQWKAYSKQESQIDPAETVTQELTVQSSEKDLLISQRISGLTKEKEYKVIIPNELFQWTCVKDNGDLCDSKDENPQTFLPDQNSLVFQYTIPIQKEDASFFLNEWTTKISEVKVRTTDIEIIDTFRRKGTWIAGAPLMGLKEMDLIDYYLFTGMGDAPSLFWQPKALYKSQDSHQIAFYKDKLGKNNEFQFEDLKNLTGFPYLSVVFTNQSGEKTGRGLMITSPIIKKEDLKRKLVGQYYETKLKGIPNKEKWLLDVLTSYTAKLEPETEKGKFILKELNMKLSKEEMKHLFNQVNNESAEITAAKLDGFIYEMKGHHTRFFTLNNSKSVPFIPFYYYDPRSIIINEKEKSDVEAIIKGNLILYPFIDTLKGLGFEVTMLPDHETILVFKDNNSYRFYLNRNIFIYNEEDYGLLENPLTNLNGEYYISKQWLQQLFKVSIDEGAEDIRISI